MPGSQYTPDRESGHVNRERRRAITTLGASATAALLAGCAGGGGSTPTPRVERETVVRERTVLKERTVIKTDTPTTGSLTQMHTIEPEGGWSVPVFLLGLNEGVWRHHGIDLSFEVASFGKFTRQVTAGLSQIGTPSTPAVINFRNQGEDVTFVGMQQTNFTNQMMARADDDSIQDPPDLSDKILGVPFLSSTTTNGIRALVIEEYDFDIIEDTAETRSAPPPVLWNLLKEGEVDAIMEFLGFVIRGLASGFAKTVFDPFEYWLEKTGSPPAVSLYTTRESWLEDNPGTALSFLQGWNDALELATEDAQRAVQNYGRLAGLTTTEEAQLWKEWIRDGKLAGPKLTQELVDNNWALIEIMKRNAGTFDELPEKDDMNVTWSQLEEMAGK